MRRICLVGVLVVAVLVLTPRAQITVPYTFTSGTTIRSSEVNANFAKFSDSLNRTGGTMTGTLTARDIAAATGATYSIGVTGTRFVNGWFSGTVTAATGFAGPVTGNVTGDLTGNVLAPDGSVGTPGIRFSSDTNTGFYRIGSDNPAVSVGGVLKASWAAALNILYNSTYGGVWARDTGTAGVDLHVRAAANKDACLSFTEDTDTDNWAIRSLADDDKLYLSSGSCASPTAVASLDASDKQFAVPAIVTSGTQNLTTADAGTDATVNADTYMLRITQGGTSSGDELTGMSGGAQGRQVLICLVDSTVGGSFNIVDESGGATAVNRFATGGGTDVGLPLDACVTAIYDGTTQRWRLNY